MTNYVANFNNKNAGTNKPVTVTGIVLTGADADNYQLNQPSSLTADIFQLELTASFTVADRVYNASAVAAVATQSLPGVIAPDIVVLSVTNAFFDNKNVGIGKTVTADTAISGADAANYTVNATATTTADITQLHITGNFTTADKFYDGGTSATVLTRTLNGVILPDAVTLDGGTATFDTKNVGDDKTVTLTGAALIGGDAPNYFLDSVGTTTADIDQLAITVDAVSDTKDYDGTTASTGVPLFVTLVGTDTGTAQQEFDSRNAGSRILSIVSGSVVISDGNGGNNYTFTTNTATGTINQREITVTAVADSREYDGTTASDETPSVGAPGIAAGDTANFTQSFDTRNAGTGKTLTPAGSVNDGNSGNNYDVTFVPVNTGAITPRAITVTAVTDTKDYDGNTSSDETPSVGAPGIATGDTAGFTQTFDNRNVGTGKLLTPAGVVNDGNLGNNYDVSFATVNTGVINQRAITVTAQTDTKTYDGTTSSDETPLVTLGSIVSGDTGVFTQVYDNANAGTNKTLIPSGSVTDGFGGNNYFITFVNDTTGVIEQADAACTITGYSDVYDAARRDRTVHRHRWAIGYPSGTRSWSTVHKRTGRNGQLDLRRRDELSRRNRFGADRHHTSNAFG